jgi:putative peptide zinc metalloprotease protein
MAPDAQIRAPADGVVERPLVAHAQRVDQHQPVVSLRSPSLVREAKIVEQQHKEARARPDVALFKDRAKLRSASERVNQSRQRLAEVQEKVASLTIASPSDGELHYFDHRALPGRFVRKGDVLAHVRRHEPAVVRVVVRQTQIEQLRNPDTGVRVLIPGYFDRAFNATLQSELGATTNTLPSAALGSAGGGRIATDIAHSDQRTAAEDVFVVDVQLPTSAPDVAIGTRVYLRFDYAPLPLAQQMLRSLRQLTLGTTRA